MVVRRRNVALESPRYSNEQLLAEVVQGECDVLQAAAAALWDELEWLVRAEAPSTHSRVQSLFDRGLRARRLLSIAASGSSTSSGAATLLTATSLLPPTPTRPHPINVACPTWHPTHGWGPHHMT